MAWTPNSFTTLASRSVSFSNANNNVTLNNHGFNNGAMIKFKTIVTTTGISVDTFYYVVNSQTNTFQVSSDKTTALTLSSDGTGTLYVLCSALANLRAITFKRVKLEQPFRKFSAINNIDNVTIVRKYITNTDLFFPYRFYSGLRTITLSSLNLAATGYSPIEQFAIPSNLNKLFFSSINNIDLISFKYGIKFNLFRKFSAINTLTVNTLRVFKIEQPFRKFSALNNIKTLTIQYSTKIVDKNIYTKYTFGALNNIKTLTIKYSTKIVDKNIYTKYTFAGLNAIRISSTALKLTDITNELFSKIKFSGLQSIRVSSTALKLTDITNELFSKIKVSGTNTIKNLTMYYSNTFADNSVTTKFTFAGLSTLALGSTSKRLINITNELISKIYFSGTNTIKTSNTSQRLINITNDIVGKIYFSSTNTIKNITMYYSNTIIDTKFTFAGLSTLALGSTSERLINITNELVSKIYFSGLNSLNNLTIYYSNAFSDNPITTKFTFGGLNTMFVKTFSLKTWKDLMSDQVTKIIQFWS